MGQGRGGGGFPGTKGGSIIFTAGTKSEALTSVQTQPKSIQLPLIRFFKGSSRADTDYSLIRMAHGGVLASYTKHGKVPGSKAVYFKEVNETGETGRVWKVTYSPDGAVVHTKVKKEGNA